MWRRSAACSQTGPTQQGWHSLFREAAPPNRSCLCGPCAPSPGGCREPRPRREPGSCQGSQGPPSLMMLQWFSEPMLLRSSHCALCPPKTHIT